MYTSANPHPSSPILSYPVHSIRTPRFYSNERKQRSIKRVAKLSRATPNSRLSTPPHTPPKKRDQQDKIRCDMMPCLVFPIHQKKKKEIVLSLQERGL